MIYGRSTGTKHPRSTCRILRFETMPELPEVETVANGVHQRIAGDRIEDVWFSSKREPMKSPPAAMAKALTGRTIERVHRVGKHIVFDFAPEPKRDPVQWIVHLGMTGRLVVADPEVPRPLHTHGVLMLGLRAGAALRGRAPLWPDGPAYSGERAAWRLYRSRQRAAAHFEGGLSPALSSPPHRRSRRRCSTRVCCTGSATSMPMRACSGPRSGLAAWQRG